MLDLANALDGKYLLRFPGNGCDFANGLISKSIDDGRLDSKSAMRQVTSMAYVIPFRHLGIRQVQPKFVYDHLSQQVSDAGK